MVDLKIDAPDFAKAAEGLKQAAKDLGREQRRANKEIGEKVAARARARADTPQMRHFASAIQGRSTQKFARIAVVSRGRNRGAAGAFYGASRWRQFPPWVGNTWRVGARGEGPYAVNPAIADALPGIEQEYLDAAERAFDRAFGGSS